MNQMGIRLLVWLHSFCIAGSLGALVLAYLERDTFAEYAVLLILFVPILLTDLAVRRIRNVLGIIGAFAVSAALISVLPVVREEQVLLTVLTAVLAAWRASARIRGTESALEAPGYYILILYGFLGVAGTMMKNGTYQNLVGLAAAGEVLIAVVYQHRKRLVEYCTNNAGLYRFPGGRILGQSRLAAGAACAGAAAVMALLWLASPQRLLYMLLELLRRLLAMLFSGIQSEPVEEIVQESEQIEMQKLELAEEEETLWDQILAVLEVVLMIVAIAVLVGAVVWGIWKLYKKYNSSVQENGDKLEFLNPFENIEEKAKEKKQRRVSRERFGSPNQAVRRIYKKEVERASDTPMQWQTPRQLEEQAGLCDDEVRREFHELYEKARYSPTGCDREDSARMKQLKPNRKAGNQ